MMYFKIAFKNISKSARDYSVYFFTLVLGAALFYSFNTVSLQADSFGVESRQVFDSMAIVFKWLTIFLATVMGFLMVYANNFLVKRRKKELGLYQLLGMRRSKVSLILVIETFLASIGSFAVGIGVGIIISQFLTFLSSYLLQKPILKYNFIFSFDAFAMTLTCFAVMFVVMLLFNVRTLRKVALVDLMSASRKNEKIFKIKNPYIVATLFLLSLALISYSYYRLIDHGFIILLNDQKVFVITTVIMLVGTALFFYSFSTGMLMILKLCKGFYFKHLNMFTIRQIASKISTTSVSSYFITLLLFIIICTVSFGMSLAASSKNTLETYAPFDLSVSFGSDVTEHRQEDKEFNSPATFMESYGVDLKNQAEIYTLTRLYRSDFDKKPDMVQSISEAPDVVTLKNLAEKSNIDLKNYFKQFQRNAEAFEAATTLPFRYMRATDYYKLCEVLHVKPVILHNNQYLLTTNAGVDYVEVMSDAMQKNTPITFFGRKLTPATIKALSGKEATQYDFFASSNFGTIIVPDDVIPADKKPEEAYLNIMYKPEAKAQVEESYNKMKEIIKAHGRAEDTRFLVQGTTRYDMIFSNSQQEIAHNNNQTMVIISLLSLYIGMVVIIACSVILSIQQLSQAADSEGSYKLLNTLGCPHKMAKRSLCAQVAVSFFIPLVVAGAHSAVALKTLFSSVANYWPLMITYEEVAAVGVVVAVYFAYFIFTYLLSRSIVFRKA